MMVKDIDSGAYFVEKSLLVTIDFQRKVFENEIRVHSQMEHRYIIKFIEQLDQNRFLMEYAFNGNLQKIIESDVDKKVRIKYCLQFLKGLAYLHDRGFAHNDVKPTNILITGSNRAKLSDFAFSGKIGEETFDNPPSHFVLGTDLFRHPKEKMCFRNKAANDIYAVGVVLYRLFAEDAGKKNRSVDLQLIRDPGLQQIIENCMDGKTKDIVSVIDSLGDIDPFV
jgi:serine/threonine protein kinase